MASIEQKTLFDHYIKEINKIPLLTREEEFDLAVKFKKENNIDAASKLVQSNLRFVLTVANEYRSYNVQLLDLIQEGNLGLMKGVEKFDPYKGYRLISYAVWWIRAYLQNFIVRSVNIVKMGTNKTQKMLFYKKNSDQEVRNEGIGNFHESGPHYATHRSGNQDFSLDEKIDNETTLTYLELIPTEEDTPEEVLVNSEEEKSIKRMIRKAMKNLNEREEYVLTHRVMADDPLTLQQIAGKFNLSKERIRQIETEALKKVKGRIPNESMLLHYFN